MITKLADTPCTVFGKALSRKIIEIDHSVNGEFVYVTIEDQVWKTKHRVHYRLNEDLTLTVIKNEPDIFGDIMNDKSRLLKDLETLENMPMKPAMVEPPYIAVAVTTIEKRYNPKYGDDRMCKCGHSYYRHFDTYEDMTSIGCKYCSCAEFKLMTLKISF